jgi:NAD(P)-dependent dehydrogenase (short-subunit alcohol dehydrogenase family)
MANHSIPVMDLFHLSGQIAIVTGGYGLYGRSITEALCEAGATVIIASRNMDKCMSLAEELNKKGFSAEGKHLDLNKESSIISLIRSVVEKHEKIDILVNNAVYRTLPQNLDEITAEEWQKSQKVNSTGLVLICREAIHVMCRQNSGAIINISSIQGVVGPNFPVYGDTGKTSPTYYTYEKWGMIGLTKWMANRYGRYNIRVNCISPGGYDPDNTWDEKNEFVQNYKRLTPLGRFADENDIKGPILFLASDASKYVTGHNLLVDGGWTSW